MSIAIGLPQVSAPAGNFQSIDATFKLIQIALDFCQADSIVPTALEDHKVCGTNLFEKGFLYSDFETSSRLDTNRTTLVWTGIQSGDADGHSFGAIFIWTAFIVRCADIRIDTADCRARRRGDSHAPTRPSRRCQRNVQRID